MRRLFSGCLRVVFYEVLDNDQKLINDKVKVLIVGMVIQPIDDNMDVVQFYDKLVNGKVDWKSEQVKELMMKKVMELIVRDKDKHWICGKEKEWQNNRLMVLTDNTDKQLTFYMGKWMMNEKVKWLLTYKQDAESLLGHNKVHDMGMEQKIHDKGNELAYHGRVKLQLL